MTNSGLVFRASGTGMPATHGGWNGVDRMFAASHIPSLQMFHLFGSSFNTVYPNGSTAEKCTGDQSWNGRHLTKIGTAVPGTKSIVLGASDYFLSPLTGDALKAMTGSFTIWTVANFTNTGAGVMGAWNTDANDGFLMGRDVGTSTRYQARTSYTSGSLTDKNTPVIATDAFTGGTNAYEILALSYSAALTATLYRQKPGGSLQSQTVSIDAVPGGAQRICIGRTYPAANYTGASAVVEAGALSMALDAAGFASLQAARASFLSGYGITL